MAQKKWRDISRRYAATVGDGAATSFTLTHNMGTRDVIVAVYATATGAAAPAANWSRAASTTNSVTVTFTVAPTANQYRIVVVGA